MPRRTPALTRVERHDAYASLPSFQGCFVGRDTSRGASWRRMLSRSSTTVAMASHYAHRGVAPWHDVYRSGTHRGVVTWHHGIVSNTSAHIVAW